MVIMPVRLPFLRLCVDIVESEGGNRCQTAVSLRRQFLDRSVDSSFETARWILFQCT